jgi:hypothetical protein
VCGRCSFSWEGAPSGRRRCRESHFSCPSRPSVCAALAAGACICPRLSLALPGHSSSHTLRLCVVEWAPATDDDSAPRSSADRELEACNLVFDRRVALGRPLKYPIHGSNSQPRLSQIFDVLAVLILNCVTAGVACITYAGYRVTRQCTALVHAVLQVCIRIRNSSPWNVGKC